MNEMAKPRNLTAKERNALYQPLRDRRNKETQVAFSFRFDKVSDSEIIEMIMSQSNKTDYVRRLIKEDLKK